MSGNNTSSDGAKNTGGGADEVEVDKVDRTFNYVLRGLMAGVAFIAVGSGVYLGLHHGDDDSTVTIAENPKTSPEATTEVDPDAGKTTVTETVTETVAPDEGGRGDRHGHDGHHATEPDADDTTGSGSGSAGAHSAGNGAQGSVSPEVTDQGRGMQFPSTGVGNGQMYLVQPGDTVWDLSLRFGVSMQALVAANNFVDPNSIWAYDTIVIPG